MAKEKANPKCPDGNEHIFKQHWVSCGNFHYEFEGIFCTRCGEIEYNAVGNFF